MFSKYIGKNSADCTRGFFVKKLQLIGFMCQDFSNVDIFPSFFIDKIINEITVQCLLENSYFSCQ